MNILITGGAGFLGQRLCKALLQQGSVARIRLFDVALANIAPSDSSLSTAVEAIAGDINNPEDLRRALGNDTDSIFHLAAVVSGEAEQNFDLGMRVNVDGTRALLEACRALPKPPKFIFTSSLAVFGGPLPNPVPDTQAPTPQNSYGAQKAMCELLINDMSRKGFIDARVLRLPTITVRPGKPNKAASSFMSGIIREPLSGVNAVCPVAPELKVWVLSPRRAIQNLLLAHALDASCFAHTRSINVPGLCVSIGEMVQALRQVAGDAVAERVIWQRDEPIEKIVASWPQAFEAMFGKSLGMQADEDFASIVRAHAANA
jgi:nucleoside-diphosphate-sugar epimerase